jgi:hypothetical protein
MNRRSGCGYIASNNRCGRASLHFHYSLTNMTANTSRDSSLRNSRTVGKTPNGPMNRSVSFTEVTVYEFPLRIGDNPACSSGCPVALAKKHLSVRKSTLSDNDENNAGNSSKSAYTKRRSSRDLMIPSDVRTKLLMANGYELQRIVKTTANMLTIQEQRRESLQKTHWEGVKSLFQTNNGKTNFRALTYPALNNAGATSA